MKTDKTFLSEEFVKCASSRNYQSYDPEYFKMNNSNSDCDQNSSSFANSDSGYLTNYNLESQSLSTSSSGLSTEDLYPQKPITSELSLQSNLYFCENAVFDEPKLEGPPILLEDMSIDLNNYLQTEKQNESLVPLKSNSSDDIPVVTPQENSSSSTRIDLLSYEHSKTIIEAANEFLVPSSDVCKYLIEQSPMKNSDSRNSQCASLKSSTGKKTPSIGESPKMIFDSDTSYSSQVNDFPFEELRSHVEEIKNMTANTVSSMSSLDNTMDSVVLNKCQNSVVTTPNKPIINKHEVSPDLFSEEEEIEEEILPLSNIIISLEALSQTQRPIVQSEQLLRNDRKLLRRVQEAVSGVPPPPSVTIIQTTVTDMLNKIHNNKHLFLTDIFSDNKEKTENTEKETQSKKSLLIVNAGEEIYNQEWPDIVNFRYHGLHFNRTKVSEDFEFYCNKYATRYVGVETASSCTVWSTNLPGSAKKRNARLRWGAKSPGRRLSHLAKRRITFSSSNLQANCSAAALSVIGSSNVSNRVKIVIDGRKSFGLSRRMKSPWKKSPRKSPQKKIKTPSSSTKKNSSGRLLYDEPQPGTSRVISTKRALFQSPDHNRSTTSSSSTKPRNLFISPHKQSPAKTKISPKTSNLLSGSTSKSRRNLFISPRKQSPVKVKISPKMNSVKNIISNPKSRRNLFVSPSKMKENDRKRKRTDDEYHPSKFPRSLSFDAHPNSIKAGSFSLQRRHSELSVSGNLSVKSELSELHKKKLLWAISEALRSQQIGMSHPKFRTFAPILCKIVKHLMPDLLSNGPRQPGSTSDRMLRIARQHVFAVSRGKSYEEIIQQVKETEENLKNVKQPIGYVAPESFKSDEKVKNVLQDKVLNIEYNQPKSVLKSPEVKGNRDENNRARIKRQILFDDCDMSKSLNTNR